MFVKHYTIVESSWPARSWLARRVPRGRAALRYARGMDPGSIVAARFEIERLAGSGGMASVYRARDLRTGEVVALKLTHGAQVMDPERFAREAEVLAELRHPGIVRYVAHGQSALGEAFLAMEWLDGEDLEQRLARAPLSIIEGLSLARLVAEALGAAHRQGIVHRDIKPSNVFLRGARSIGRCSSTSAWRA